MIDEKKLIAEIRELKNHYDFFYKQGRSEVDDVVKNASDTLFNDVAKIIYEQPKVGEWIPCSERLPEPYDMVNISAKMPDHKEALVYMGSIDGDVLKQWYILGVTNSNDYNVIAWQPLPKPWEGEE